MGRLDSESAQRVRYALTATPTAAGLSIALAPVLLDSFLVPFEAATVGVLLLTAGAVCYLQGRDRRADAARAPAVVGAVLVVARSVGAV